MTNKEKILFVLILIFLTTLFLPWLKLLNIFAAIFLGLYAFFFNSWQKDFFKSWKENFSGLLEEKWQLLKQRKYLVWMFVFFLMVVISVLLSSNFHKGLRYLDPRLPLLYFPVSIGLLKLRKEFKEKVLLGFAWLTTAVVLFCFCWALNRSAFFEKPEFLYNDSLTEILGQQSIYISLLVNFAIYVFCYNIFYKSLGRGWMLFATLFLFTISYFLASRVMIVTMFSFILAFAFYNITFKKKYLTGIALVLGLVVGIFLIFKVFPKTLNRFNELAFTEFNYESTGTESHYNSEVTKQQWNGVNFRLAVWQCGWELFLAHPVKGVDIGDKKDALMDKYREKNFQFALQTGKNVHSNYLDILYSMGIIGLSLFFIGWIVLPLVYAKQNNDWLSILMILTFATAWISEIYFDRSLGGMLTGFFIPFLLTDNKNEK
jgi:O-antigen ligase